MDRPKIARVRLVCSGARVPRRSLAHLASEYPTVEIEHAERPGVDDPIVDAAAWLKSRELATLDDVVRASISDAITVLGPHGDLGCITVEVLTRWQRYIERRNDASRAPIFDAVLRAHAALHDLTKPLVKAEHDHAIDTWQWMLRLDPEASLPAQLAALFHDVERLEHEFARRGGEVAEEVLLGAGVDRDTSVRVAEIVASRERRGRDAEVDLVNDADGLSFLSLTSSGYADSFGAERTRKKVAETLARLGRGARARLGGVRLRPDVGQHVLDHLLGGTAS